MRSTECPSSSRKCWRGVAWRDVNVYQKCGWITDQVDGFLHHVRVSLETAIDRSASATHTCTPIQPASQLDGNGMGSRNVNTTAINLHSQHIDCSQLTTHDDDVRPAAQSTLRRRLHLYISVPRTADRRPTRGAPLNICETPTAYTQYRQHPPDASRSGLYTRTVHTCKSFKRAALLSSAVVHNDGSHFYGTEIGTSQYQDIYQSTLSGHTVKSN